MSSVHVLCAPPNGRNPGMTAVDRAFATVAQGLGADVTYWRLWDVGEWRESGGRPLEPGSLIADPFNGIDYRLLRFNLSEFLEADAVVYWGDFLHMRVYLDMTVDVLDRRIGVRGATSTAEWVRSCLLGRGQTRGHLERSLTFGTTLSMNSAEDYASGYDVELGEFVRGVRRAWFRDPYSAAVAQLYRNAPSENCAGVDAAMLLETGKDDPPADEVAVFVGRSALAPEWVGQFGARLARRLRLDPRWLRWGEQPAFWPMRDSRRLRVAWPGLDLNKAVPPPLARARARTEIVLGRGGDADPAPSFQSLLAQVSRSKLVLTDTYHLAVLAWRSGTPAVCIIDRPPGEGWSVNGGGAGSRRDKRTDLYSQLDVMPLLADSAQRPAVEAERIAAVLSERPEVVDQGVRRLTLASRRARDAVTEELGAMLH